MSLNDRSFKQVNAEHLSQDTKNNIISFVETDKQFDSKLQAFLEKHSEELLDLDNVREKRNRVLDEAQRGLRRDAELAPREKMTDPKTGSCSISYGPFTVQKKESESYLVDTFVAIATRFGHQKAMVDSGAIQIKTEVDFDNAKEFLRKNDITKEFAAAYMTQELTPAVLGPKDIPPFGAPVKKK